MLTPVSSLLAVSQVFFTSSQFLSVKLPGFFWQWWMRLINALAWDSFIAALWTISANSKSSFEWNGSHGCSSGGSMEFACFIPCLNSSGVITLTPCLLWGWYVIWISPGWGAFELKTVRFIRLGGLEPRLFVAKTYHSHSLLQILPILHVHQYPQMRMQNPGNLWPLSPGWCW